MPLVGWCCTVQWTGSFTLGNSRRFLQSTRRVLRAHALRPTHPGPVYGTAQPPSRPTPPVDMYYDHRTLSARPCPMIDHGACLIFPLHALRAWAVFHDDRTCSMNIGQVLRPTPCLVTQGNSQWDMFYDDTRKHVHVALFAGCA